MIEHGTGYCDITCHTLESFRSWPDAEVDRVVDLIREASERSRDGRLSKAKAEEVQMVCGLRYNASGLLASSRLRTHCSLIGAVTYDWVHSALQDGCFVLEASLIAKACGGVVEASDLARVHACIAEAALLVDRECLLVCLAAASPLIVCRYRGGVAACGAERRRIWHMPRKITTGVQGYHPSFSC